MAVNCGKCKGQHANVAEVKECYVRNGGRANQGGKSAASRRSTIDETPTTVDSPATHSRPAQESEITSVPQFTMSDRPCIHGIDEVTCSICKVAGLPDVYISGGGSKFHARPDCAALLKGQQRVKSRNGVTEPIERVVRGSAKVAKRDPCRTCHPK